MNLRLQAKWLAAIAVVGVLGASVFGQEWSSVSSTDSLSYAEGQVAGSVNRFGIKVFQELVKRTPGTENVLISPVAVASAMGLLYNAAEGETRREIQEALKLYLLEPDEINRAFGSLRQRLMKADDRANVRLAASLWAGRGKELRPEYVDLATDFFDAEVGLLDLRAKSDVERINAWCDRATNGMIKRIVEPPLSQGTAAILLNTAYFKSLWTYPFDSAKTVVDTFTLSDGSTRSCQMMWLTEEDCLLDQPNNWIKRTDSRISIHADPSLVVLGLPYGNGAYRMTIVGPTEHYDWEHAPVVDINEVISALTIEKFRDWQKTNHDRMFVLGLPRLSFETASALGPVLREVGIKSAFDCVRADLGGLFPDKTGWVEQVNQKARIRVDETGTEVAEVVQTVFADSIPPMLRCNRPFMIVISEKSTGLILFIGRIGNPEWDA